MDYEGRSIRVRYLAASVEARLFGSGPPPVRAGRFEVLERIGAGGMGVVYRARDPELDRLVAVKLLPRRDQHSAARLRREAKVLARLNHPNVVAVYEVGHHGDETFVAMEYVRGGTLRDWCIRNPPGTRRRSARIVALFRQAVDGLAAAHRAGIVHRDIKPGNILVGEDDRVRLADFGVAARLRLAAVGDRLVHGPGEPTTDEAIAGTPAYMAAEQLQGVATAASDQFSLCLTFREALIGKHPFLDEAGCVANIRDGRLVHEPTGPGWLCRALRRGLALDPADRFDHLDDLAAALARRSRRIYAFAGVGAAVAASAAVAAMAGDEAPCRVDEARLGDAWSPQRQREIEAALSAGSATPTIWLRVRHEFDRAVARWRDENLRACVMERSAEPELRETGRRRRACSHRAAAALQAASDALVDGDADRMNRAPELANTLPNLVDCEGALGLVPPYAVTLISRLDQALIAQKLGQRQRVVEHIEAFLAATDVGELPSHRARAWAVLAWNSRVEENYEDEREYLTAALTEAELADDADRIVQIWGDIAILEARGGHEERASFALERAQSFGQQGRTNAARAAGLIMVEGNVHALLEHWPQAEAAYAGAVEACGRAWPDSVLMAWALTNHGRSLLALGRHAEALEVTRDAAQLMSKAAGPGHPDTAVARGRFGAALAKVGQHDAARTELAAALRVFEADPAAFRSDRDEASATLSRLTDGP